MPRTKGAKSKDIPARLELVAQMLAINQPPSRIKLILREKFALPKLSYRTVARYITAAQKMMLDRIGTKTTEDHAADAYNTYTDLIRRFHDKPDIVLRARDALDRMMGTNGNSLRAKADAADAERAASRDRDPRELLDALNRVIRQLEADAGGRQATGTGETAVPEQPKPA